MKKIVSHLPPRHLDDFLALSVLKNLFVDAEIEFINPQKVPAYYYDDKEIALVDIGEKHSPEFNNFDHHQDINLPCALALVLKKFFRIKINNSPLLNIIDKIDRFGFFQAKKILAEAGHELKTDESIENKRRILLFTDLSIYGQVVGRHFLENISLKDYEFYIKSLYSLLESLGALEIPKQMVKKEDGEFEEKIQNIKVFEISGLKIALLKDHVSAKLNEVFNRTNADILVEPNGMEVNQTVIIKNGKSAFYDKIDLAKIFTKYNKVFIHATGFLAIVDIPVERINIEDFVIIVDK
ncbi:MAG: hypothetical protein N2202_07150 [Proteobacteria bacterium]|nr:hypothetical protein [Pseudomonadota bacterium]